MTKDEALKMALDYIEGKVGASPSLAAIAIREALAQPEQEPAAWMWEKSNYPESRTVEIGLLFKKTDSYGDVEWTPLYTSPPAKPWVGLTHADFDWLEQMFGSSVSNDFVFADIVCVIEAKLKEKNA